ncbi:MAG TPA: hypothetical protein VGA98_03340 [Allosphingosinicella sp.]
MASFSRAALAFALAAVGAAAAAGPAVAQGGGAASPRPATVRPAIVRPDAEESLQWAAAVVSVDPLRRQGLTAKLFGTAGGDPAMNGLYTQLAFFKSVEDGWRVFRLGDFLSYRILAEAPGRLTLEVRESVLDEATGGIGARTRRLLVSWKGGSGREPPSSVTVAAAR